MAFPRRLFLSSAFLSGDVEREAMPSMFAKEYSLELTWTLLWFICFHPPHQTNTTTTKPGFPHPAGGGGKVIPQAIVLVLRSGFAPAVQIVGALPPPTEQLAFGGIMGALE